MQSRRPDLRLANGLDIFYVKRPSSTPRELSTAAVVTAFLEEDADEAVVVKPYRDQVDALMDGLAAQTRPQRTHLTLVASNMDRLPLGRWETGFQMSDAELVARSENHVKALLEVKGGPSILGVLGSIATMSAPRTTAFKRCQAMLRGLEFPGGYALPGDTSIWFALRWVMAAHPLEEDGRIRRIWGRQLVTAALLAMPDTPLLEVLGSKARLGQLRDDWFRFVSAPADKGALQKKQTSSRPGMNWRRVWSVCQLRPPQVAERIPGYRSDAVGDEDQLGIDPEARALARLIVDNDVAPPLSIGLLGDWGCGKSFYMERVRHHVDDLVRTPGCVRGVAHVHFNAWHACDEQLWPALVRELLGTLHNELVPPDATSRDELRRRLEQERAKSKGIAEGLERAIEAEEAARAARDQAREEAALKNVLGETVVTELKVAARSAGLGMVVDSFDSVQAAAQKLQEAEQTRFLQAALRQWDLIGLAGLTIFAGTVLIAWLGELVSLDLQTAGGIASTMLVGAVVIREVSKGIAEGSDYILRLNKRYEEALAQAEEDEEEGGELVEKQRALSKAQASYTDHLTRLEELRQQISGLDPFTRIASFLGDRLSSADYTERRGILSIVREDLEALSRLLEDWRTGKSRRIDGIEPMDRIVVYVDDLDRCPPGAVVQMLEAIHLLLSVPAFVVIAAVDSRWLGRSLEVHYKQLLNSEELSAEDDGVSPQNYLEKIFQVPYALAPMSRRGFRSYLEHLLPSPAQLLVSNEDPPDEAELTDPFGRQARLGPTWPGRRLPPEPPATYRPMEFDRRERDCIRALLPLLPTPRATKRLVNVYRLIKAGVRPEDIESGAWSERGPQAAFLLALLFGRPDEAHYIFPWLLGAPIPVPPADPEDMTDPETRARQQATHQLAAAWALVNPETPTVPANLGETLKALRLGRYSFQTARAWTTWPQPEDDE